MSLTTFERLIIGELYRITGKKIREKELLEWRSAPPAPREGERVIHCPENGVWVAIPDTIKIKPSPATAD